MTNKVILLLFIALLPSCGQLQQSGESADLTFKWELFPDPRKEVVNPDEEIVFKLTPKNVAKRMSRIIMDFDDGSIEEKKLDCRGGDDKFHYKPVHFSHIYQEENRYRPQVKPGSESFFSVKGGVSFIIAPKVDSDRALKEKAFEDSVRQLQVGINTVLSGRDPAKVKLALTSFKNANFEYAKTEDDMRDITIINKLTTTLVNNGYSILEKSPQALIRLAHEAIVKKDSLGNTTDEYQDSLEYGLRTEYNDPSQPFVYGAEIEGVKATDKEHISAKRKSSDGFFGNIMSRKSKQDGSGSGKAEKTQRSSNNKEAVDTYIRSQNRAMHFAKFSTADFVITIDRKPGMEQDIILKKSEPIYYDIKFETEMIERKAQTEYSVRILERNGNIVWVQNIVGQAQDRVVPDFVRNSEKKKINSFGDLFKGLLSK